MRRRHLRKQFRPSLPRRAIVWFPKFEAPEGLLRLQRYRLEHDPLGAKIAPHLAVVFPFHASLTVAQLVSHVKRATVGWPVLPVTFRGVESVASPRGLFTLLMCDLRHEAVTELHDRLYRGVLAGFLRDDIEYRPHITLAQSNTNAAFDAALADAELRFRDTYRATMRDLSIITHAADGTITIDKTVSLSRE
ncbi:MAG: 2'-5' RNA ligase family protein [Burkholderiales bacterium]|nr:2'-5' RNA ligase family protein [Rhodocyclaceae bacterium]